MKIKILVLTLAHILLLYESNAQAEYKNNVFYQNPECTLDQPIDLETDDPRYPFSKPLMLKYVVFDKEFETEAVDYSEHFDMSLKLFRLWSDSTEITENLGVAYRPGDNEPWWVFAGFSTSYPSTYKVTGSISKKGDQKIYHTRVEYPYLENKTSPVVEVTVVMEESYLISLKLTVPVEKPCVLNGYSMYCQFVERNETLCLKSAQLSYSK